MVFHHTFDPDEIIPNTQKYVEGRGMTLDLLFNEDQGILSCRRNEDSKISAADFLSQYQTANSGGVTGFLSDIRSIIMIVSISVACIDSTLALHFFVSNAFRCLSTCTLSQYLCVVSVVLVLCAMTKQLNLI